MPGGKEMEQSEQRNVILAVEDEQSLYSKFSPEDEFNEAVKGYIRSKVTGKDSDHSVNLTVRSNEPISEERFRSAVSNWIRDEKAMFRKQERETIRTLIGSLIFGSIMIIISIALQQRYEVLKYSLIPIMGSLALSNAAKILAVELPTNTARKRLFREMETNSKIIFEYGQDQTALPDSGKAG